MSSKSQRRKRRQLNETPLLVERIQKAEQGFEDFTASGPRLTYEEARWPYLSPTFREAHNRRLQAKGLPTIPPPKVDMYVKPQAAKIRTFDPTDKEFLAATREFMGGRLMAGGAEGMTINGKPVKL
jgi:hypothetical protein